MMFSFAVVFLAVFGCSNPTKPPAEIMAECHITYTRSAPTIAAGPTIFSLLFIDQNFVDTIISGHRNLIFGDSGDIVSVRYGIIFGSKPVDTGWSSTEIGRIGDKKSFSIYSRDSSWRVDFRLE
jgi:hypothetical protein